MREYRNLLFDTTCVFVDTHSVVHTRTVGFEKVYEQCEHARGRAFQNCESKGGYCGNISVSGVHSALLSKVEC